MNKYMKAEDLVNNNSLTNIEVTGGDTVVYTEIALTAINMARMEEREIALKNQWISVKEQLPEPDKNVILSIQGLPVIGLGENVKDESLNITHWMAIPSFDQILEVNKDVLQRMK